MCADFEKQTHNTSEIARQALPDENNFKNFQAYDVHIFFANNPNRITCE